MKLGTMHFNTAVLPFNTNSSLTRSWYDCSTTRFNKINHAILLNKKILIISESWIGN